MNYDVVTGWVSGTFALTNNISQVDFLMTQTLGKTSSIRPSLRYMAKTYHM